MPCQGPEIGDLAGPAAAEEGGAAVEELGVFVSVFAGDGQRFFEMAAGLVVVAEVEGDDAKLSLCCSSRNWSTLSVELARRFRVLESIAKDTRPEVLVSRNGRFQ